MSENIDSSEEVWRDISGYEGLYQVSSWGNVRSFYGQGRILCPWNNRYGYLIVTLCKECSHKAFSIHILVAQAFIPNPSNLPCVNHLDENKMNNRVENLEWVTHLQNNLYGSRIERIRQKLVGNTFSQKGADERKRAVMQFSRDGKRLATFDSAYAAARSVTGMSARNKLINECCQRKKRTAYGFVWRYADENGGGTKLVALVDEAGNILRSFSSVRQAAKDLDIPQTSIRSCCNGRAKTTHGMRFQYLERESA